MLTPEVSELQKKHPDKPIGPDLRLEPQERLCPKFDEESIALHRVAGLGDMGVRVVDNCAEEHIM